jgi:hypothetical protein
LLLPPGDHLVRRHMGGAVAVELGSFRHTPVKENIICLFVIC